MDNIRVQWMESTVPAHLPVTQVYGFCFDPAGRALLIEDAERFGLPGGKPEGSESHAETLKREAMEEARVVLGEVAYLGYQLVEGDPNLMRGEPYAQVRAVARLARILPSALDPATGLTYRRFLCPPSSAPGLLRWGESGEAQVAAACRLVRQLWRVSYAASMDTSAVQEPQQV